MRIKEEDEWKVAFTTPKGSFEPMVMFFSLINSLVTFQTIMNEILWDFINTGKVASFIDDVIIGTEGEEGHNELVENDLYIKLEKCKWKVKEVEFLGVVIGLEGIKMEEDKMKEMIDWLIPKCVMLQTQVLRIGQVNEPCIGLT